MTEWQKTAADDDPRCEACKSFQGLLGVSTNDSVSQINYLSSQVGQLNFLVNEVSVTLFADKLISDGSWIFASEIFWSRLLSFSSKMLS